MRHVIVYAEANRTLIDRTTLAYLTGRSVETIRRRCTVVDYQSGRALYDLDAATATLDAVPKRRNRPVGLTS